MHFTLTCDLLNERSNSTLKNLKACLRGTMGQERLSSLALMHIHYTVLLLML